MSNIFQLALLCLTLAFTVTGQADTCFFQVKHLDRNDNLLNAENGYTVTVGNQGFLNSGTQFHLTWNYGTRNLEPVYLKIESDSSFISLPLNEKGDELRIIAEDITNQDSVIIDSLKFYQNCSEVEITGDKHYVLICDTCDYLVVKHENVLETSTDRCKVPIPDKLRIKINGKLYKAEFKRTERNLLNINTTGEERIPFWALKNPYRGETLRTDGVYQKAWLRSIYEVHLEE